MEEQQFDELTKKMAASVSRRTMIKVVVSAAVGGFFPLSKMVPGLAKGNPPPYKPVCRPGEQPCGVRCVVCPNGCVESQGCVCQVGSVPCQYAPGGCCTPGTHCSFSGCCLELGDYCPPFPFGLYPCCGGAACRDGKCCLTQGQDCPFNPAFPIPPIDVCCPGLECTGPNVFQLICCPEGTINCQHECCPPDQKACCGGPSGRCCKKGQCCENGRCVDTCSKGGPCCDGSCCARGECCDHGTCVSTCANGGCCDRGTCVSSGATCSSGGTCCSGRCTNTQTDNNNCGSCGNVCPSGSTCQKGKCLCSNGQPPPCACIPLGSVCPGPPGSGDCCPPAPPCDPVNNGFCCLPDLAPGCRTSDDCCTGCDCCNGICCPASACLCIDGQCSQCRAAGQPCGGGNPNGRNRNCCWGVCCSGVCCEAGYGGGQSSGCCEGVCWGKFGTGQYCCTNPTGKETRCDNTNDPCTLKGCCSGTPCNADGTCAGCCCWGLPCTNCCDCCPHWKDQTNCPADGLCGNGFICVNGVCICCAGGCRLCTPPGGVCV